METSPEIQNFPKISFWLRRRSTMTKHADRTIDSLFTDAQGEMI